MSDKQLYSYADVIIDPDDPRVEIGREYWFGDVPGELLSHSNKDKPNCHGVLHDVGEDGEFYPFCVCVDGVNYIEAACLIRKKESEKRYIPFDLSKPEVRDSLRGKWFYYPSTDSELMIDCFSHMDSQWRVHGLTSDQFLNACTFLDGSPCGQEVSE